LPGFVLGVRQRLPSSRNQVLISMPSKRAYQRLRHMPPQLPPHRLLPRMSLTITSNNTAPIAALTIAETSPNRDRA
jgi:hypothetical protein